jgi:hypothetical protein
LKADKSRGTENEWAGDTTGPLAPAIEAILRLFPKVVEPREIHILARHETGFLGPFLLCALSGTTSRTDPRQGGKKVVGEDGTAAWTITTTASERAQSLMLHMVELAALLPLLPPSATCTQPTTQAFTVFTPFHSEGGNEEETM